MAVSKDGRSASSQRAMRIASAAAFAFAAVMFAPSASHAQTRRYGIGTVVGGGFSYNVIPELRPPAVAFGPQADFGTLELRFFFPRGDSIDLYSPIGNTLISSTLVLAPRAPNDNGVLVFAAIGALYNANLPLGGPWHLLAAAGLEVGGDYGVGGRYDRTHPVKFALRIPARVGVERLVPSASLGLLLHLRAFYEPIGYGSQDGSTVLEPGAALLLEAGIVFYPGLSRARDRGDSER